MDMESKKRILVVDDNGIQLRSVRTMLVDLYEVDVATNGQKAIEKAKKVNPDLILLDYEMPVMDGKETLEEIRKDEELKDIPVVFFTSLAIDESVMEELKPEGCLVKPIDPKSLLETIASIFGS